MDEERKEATDIKLHLTDDDIEKLVDKMCSQMENRLYNNVGAGVVSLVWRGLFMAIIALAAYGVGSHFTNH